MNDNDKTPVSQPILNLPRATQALLLVNVLCFLVQVLLPEQASDKLVMALAFIPARYSGGMPFGLSAIIAPVTHMFLHGGWLHLGVNMLALMAMGTGIERAIGARKMLLFYFATGILAAAIHALVHPHAIEPMIGASGAISGLFGGILLMMSNTGLAGSSGFAQYKKLLPAAGIWIAASVFFGVFGMPGVDNPIAWDVHVSGFIGGLLLFKPIAKLKI